MNNKVLFLSFTVSLGGFLFGFDAGIISGVMNFVGPEFELNEVQTGWVVSSPSFAAMIAMLIAGKSYRLAPLLVNIFFTSDIPSIDRVIIIFL